MRKAAFWYNTRMNTTLLRIAYIVAAVVLAFAVYLLPDIVANLGETVSFRLKGAIAILFFVASIVFEQRKKAAVATFTLTTGVVLTLLLFFGGAIRIAELG